MQTTGNVWRRLLQRHDSDKCTGADCLLKDQVVSRV
jgi:hypothetical protein